MFFFKSDHQISRRERKCRHETWYFEKCACAKQLTSGGLYLQIPTTIVLVYQMPCTKFSCVLSQWGLVAYKSFLLDSIACSSTTHVMTHLIMSI